MIQGHIVHVITQFMRKCKNHSNLFQHTKQKKKKKKTNKTSTITLGNTVTFVIPQESEKT